SRLTVAIIYSRSLRFGIETIVRSSRLLSSNVKKAATQLFCNEGATKNRIFSSNWFIICSNETAPCPSNAMTVPLRPFVSRGVVIKRMLSISVDHCPHAQAVPGTGGCSVAHNEFVEDLAN